MGIGRRTMKGRPQKYTAIGLCVGAVPARAARCEIGVEPPFWYNGRLL